ncbi:MAG: T9SS type A sorting domain-containing protein, partial [Methanococcaceae archaeon]
LVDAASGVLNVDPREKGNLKYALEQNYPNPFNPSTRVKYSIAEDTKVRITVFNTLGEVVKVVLDQTQKQGNYETTIDMKGFASGIYFYQLNTERYSEVRKLVLIK